MCCIVVFVLVLGFFSSLFLWNYDRVPFWWYRNGKIGKQSQNNLFVHSYHTIFEAFVCFLFGEVQRNDMKFMVALYIWRKRKCIVEFFFPLADVRTSKNTRYLSLCFAWTSLAISGRFLRFSQWSRVVVSKLTSTSFHLHFESPFRLARTHIASPKRKTSAADWPQTHNGYTHNKKKYDKFIISDVFN